MPNWSENRFVIYGEKGQLIKFYMDMSIATSKNPNFAIVDNSWDNLWVGNLFLGAGYSQTEVEENFQCRGGVDELILKEDCIVIYDHTAWEPNEESMLRMLEEKYPGLQMVFKAEEPGADIWINTDTTGRFIPERFAIDCWCSGDYFESVSEGYEDVEDVLRALSDISGRPIEEVRAVLGDKEIDCVDWSEWLCGVYNIPDSEDCACYIHTYENTYL